MIFDKYTEEEQQIRKQLSLDLQDEDMEEIKIDLMDFTFQNIGVKEQSSIHWLNIDKIKEKWMNKMKENN